MKTGNDIFLQACRGKKVSRIPVWFMRQAGRSLPGYRQLRKKYDVLTLTKTPQLAAQISLEPVKKLDVDAAILFADIMLLPLAMGVNLKIVDAVGPVISAPLKNQKDINALKTFEAASVEYLAKTIAILKNELPVPLIGFSGAPFTLASYLIEGRPSRTWIKTKQFMLTKPQAWNSLMKILSAAIIGYLGAQADAGVDAVQLFDSWAGCLSPLEYRRYVLPHVQHIFSALKNNNVPRIYFGTNTAGFLEDFCDVDCEVIGIDWRMDIRQAKKIIGKKAVQGNLDPAVLLADTKTIKTHADRIINSLDAKKGFIFNLGHGVLPETDDKKLKQLVNYIHGK